MNKCRITKIKKGRMGLRKWLNVLEHLLRSPENLNPNPYHPHKKPGVTAGGGRRISEFKASLSCTVSSKTDRETLSWGCEGGKQQE